MLNGSSLLLGAGREVGIAGADFGSRMGYLADAGADFANDLTQIIAHDAHRAHQLPQLIAAIGVHSHAQIAVGDTLGGFQRIAQRAGDLAGNDHRDNNAQHQRGQGHRRHGGNGGGDVLAGHSQLFLYQRFHQLIHLRSLLNHHRGRGFLFLIGRNV